MLLLINAFALFSPKFLQWKKQRNLPEYIGYFFLYQLQLFLCFTVILAEFVF